MTLAAMLFLGVNIVLSQLEADGLETRRFELQYLVIGATAYFLLGALNFLVATKDRLKPWMSWAFNLGEVILVSIQLYIDVLDPETPSLLAFASPVLLVAVLVICVQVLRFKIKLHIFSTLLLIALCALILFHDPQIGSTIPDRVLSEVQLLYSVPPNMMRLVMLLAVAALIGVAVYRSKRLIERVARETEIAENRKRFLPAEIANSMSDEKLEALRLAEEREIAVLFVDIRGFTGISERNTPRETARLLSQFRTNVTDVMVDHNGVVDKFIGDGALVIFGLHCEIEQACSQALSAAKKMLTVLESWNAVRNRQSLEELKIAMGVHAGPAVIGAIGDDERLEFTAIGNTINLASRLEELAKQQDLPLVASITVLELANASRGDFVSLERHALRGSTKKIEIFAPLDT